MTTSDNTPRGGSQRDPLADPVTPAVLADSSPSTEGVSGLGTGRDTDRKPRSGSDSSPASGQSSTADAAKGEGQQVAAEAKKGGQHVAGVAKEEATKVVSTAGEQAKSLLSQGTSQVSEQAGVQKQRLAEGLMSLSAELDTMASSSQGSSPVSGLVSSASKRTSDLASWLENNEPGAALEEVKAFARRRPGTFILAAAGIGLLAGRLTRGLTADDSSDTSASTAGHRGAAGYPGPGGQYAAPTAPVVPPMPPVGAGSEYDETTGYPATTDYPDTSVGHPSEEFGTGRPTFEGPGSR